MKIYDSVGTINVDYRMQYYDVITNPRWPTAANTKIVMSAYLSENDPIMTKFVTMYQIVTLLKVIRSKLKK